jgi:hypothetical protein
MQASNGSTARNCASAPDHDEQRAACAAARVRATGASTNSMPAARDAIRRRLDRTGARVDDDAGATARRGDAGGAEAHRLDLGRARQGKEDDVRACGDFGDRRAPPHAAGRKPPEGRDRDRRRDRRPLCAPGCAHRLAHHAEADESTKKRARVTHRARAAGA